MTETENQNVQKPEEMNNQNNNIKNEIRQRNAVLINQQTKRQIRDWLEGNPYQELLEYMKSRVMGQENIAIVVANVYNYLKNVSIPDTGMEMPTHGNCNNMILAAPSGSGKTETYRAFKDYFKKRIPALHHTALIMEMSTLRCSIICLRWLKDHVWKPSRDTLTQISCCSLAWVLSISFGKRGKMIARSRLDLEQVEVMKLWKLNMRLR